ncbi:dolichyl-diphosphooligosaccharide-proteinglycotransferase [Lichtheimia corymbifera JMRC:FSU:9682]|uniref:Dolichyl-diphosphooligosaccharide-proteinglycotransferase n=1 Tax=Lichtheimia corymbifera JMRC:FSU:9682 TaxID=1263082 RepID=A0A068S0B8_9FUNG|nr:dolichyl-diphosphooligosaccharide-proteinglycotransferase [Lichtheimia corymbifera JMRC:FSU:9682]
MKRSLVLVAAILLQCLAMVYAEATDAKTQRLAKMAKNNNGLVKLTSNTYTQFTEGKRNYGMVVLLTALGDYFNCGPCREFDPEYKLVASSFQSTEDPTRVFFGHLDFKDGQAIYQKLGLQTAPNVLYFPPAKPGQKVEPTKYDLARSGFSAESFANFVSRVSGLHVPVKRPFDYFSFGIKAFLVVGAAAILKLLYRHFSLVFHHKNTWAAFSILFILIMISGQMWNQIRNPPYVMPGPNGKMNFVAGGFQQQLGLESRIVAAIYGILAMATVALAVFVPKIKDKQHQRISTYVWVMCIFIVFSGLMNLFKLKNGAYPFRILF